MNMDVDMDMDATWSPTWIQTWTQYMGMDIGYARRVRHDAEKISAPGFMVWRVVHVCTRFHGAK